MPPHAGAPARHPRGQPPGSQWQRRPHLCARRRRHSERLPALCDASPAAGQPHDHTGCPSGGAPGHVNRNRQQGAGWPQVDQPHVLDHAEELFRRADRDSDGLLSCAEVATAAQSTTSRCQHLCADLGTACSAVSRQILTFPHAAPVAGPRPHTLSPLRVPAARRARPLVRWQCIKMKT